MVELITEVDENDKVIGLRPRTEFHKGEYIHRAVGLILFNSQGEILLQKRSPTKKWSPNLYSFSVAGTVGDETYEECILREMDEEIGIDTKLKWLFKYRYFKKGVDNLFGKIFIGQSDCTIKIQKEEVASIKWILPEELKKDIQLKPKKYSPAFLKGMGQYFEEFYKP